MRRCPFGVLGASSKQKRMISSLPRLFPAALGAAALVLSALPGFAQSGEQKKSPGRARNWPGQKFFMRHADGRGPNARPSLKGAMTDNLPVIESYNRDALA